MVDFILHDISSLMSCKGQRPPNSPPPKNCSISSSPVLWGAPQAALAVKNPPATRETWVWSLDWEDPLEEGMATHSSILAWRIPWTAEPGGLQSMGSQRVRRDWVTIHHTGLKQRANEHYRQRPLCDQEDGLWAPNKGLTSINISDPCVIKRMGSGHQMTWHEILALLFCDPEQVYKSHVFKLQINRN